MSEAYDGVFSVFTGEDDISKLDELDMWNYTRKTRWDLAEVMEHIFKNPQSKMYLLKFLRIVLRNGKRIVRWRMAAQERTHKYLHVFERSLSVLRYSMQFIITFTDDL